MRIGVSVGLKSFYGMSVFNTLTPDELMFGYEEKLTKIASTIYPREKRPPSKMGLLIGVSINKLFILKNIRLWDLKDHKLNSDEDLANFVFFQRNSSLLNDVETIYTGEKGMENFGLLDKLNGLDHLPYWNSLPCNNIRASEGIYFYSI